MSQVTITLNGRTTTVDREVAERQIVKAEGAIAQLNERAAVRRADRRYSAADQAMADANTAADIAKFASLIAACRAALEG